MTEQLNVLVVGATGSVGSDVVAEAVRQGHSVRALTRNAGRANAVSPEARRVVGDVTRTDTLAEAVDGIDAIVFTHGAAYGSQDIDAVDYGGVRNVLAALAGSPVRIALMTSIGVTGRGVPYDAKRRSERLVRASGNDYTIVRPGWFDANDDDQLLITMLQGDTRQSRTPADGVIARRQIARVLVDALTLDAAKRKTFELVAEHGQEQADLAPVFDALEPDPAGQVDGVHDQANMPVEDEPASIRRDLDLIVLAD